MNNKATFAGQTLGRYRFDTLIGKGAVGEVYRAFDERLLRPVAVKISFPRSSSDVLHVDRIVREAQIIARVEHSNIVPIYDVVDHEQSALIVMRLVNGMNLGQLMRENKKPMGVRESFKIIHQVVLGMDFAHSKGVVHSDLKPENIFITDSNEVFVLDFGIAALLELERKEEGKIYGTPLYMPPEQFYGAYLDARADIYSLGLILYKLVTGIHPFSNTQSLKELLNHQVKTIPEAPANLVADMPLEFSNCIMRALEKEPKNRFYSCRDFLLEMQKALPGLDVGGVDRTDTRWDPRTDVEIRATLNIDGEQSLDAKITNISVSGASLVAPVSPRAGSTMQLGFEVEEDGNRVSMLAMATVMWVDQRSEDYLYEIGVTFDDLDEMDKQYLGYYVRNLLLA